jgi:hypothetical protein
MTPDKAEKAMGKSHGFFYWRFCNERDLKNIKK